MTAPALVRLWRPLVATVCALVLVAGIAACRREMTIRVDRIEIPHHTASLVGLGDVREKLFLSSLVLWKSSQERAVLSWEVIATATITGYSPPLGEGAIGGPVPPIRIAACDNRNATTNQPFDPPLIMASWAPFLPGSLQQCTTAPLRPGEFPYDGPINPVAFSNCVDLPNPCAAGTSDRFPYCQKLCSVAADSDSVFAYPYPPGVSGGPPTGKIYLSPAYKVVSTVRSLGRRARFDHRTEAEDKDVWTWTEGPPENKTLFENFSPSLFISKVRAFLPAPTAADPEAKRYLTISRFEPEVPGIECVPGPVDGTQITTQDCPSLMSFTPAFSLVRPEDIDQVITWDLTLRPGDTGNAGIDERSPVFVEFTLGTVLNRTAGPRLSSATIDLGSAPARPGTLDGSVRLENPFAGGKWRLEQIDVTGRDTGDFSVDIDGSAPTARDLWPSASIPVGIHLRTDRAGSKEAGLVFRLRNPDGGAQALTASLAARVLAPATMTLLPDHLDFSQASGSPLPWTARFTVVNDGSLSLDRQGILLEGPDAANFHVYASDGIHDPVGRTTVASGQSETFVVEYCPRESRRSHQARVHVYAANGTMNGQPVEGILALTANAPPSVAPCLLRTPPPRPTGIPQ